MLGTACFRLCARGNYGPSTSALSHSHPSSPCASSTTIISRHTASLNISRNLGWPRQRAAAVSSDGCALHIASSVKRFCCHSSSCLAGGNELSCATIWHGLLPSHHPSILDQNVVSPVNNSYSFSSYDPLLGSTPASTLIIHCEDQGRTDLAISSPTGKCASGLSLPHGTVGGTARFAMAGTWLDGSWNVAWDARPARWLHGRHSAWLLFGVCACFSAAAGASLQNKLPSSSLQNTVPSPFEQVEDIAEHLDSVQSNSDHEAVAAKTIEGRQVFTDFTVTGIPGDGRCLFRAVSHGACLRSGTSAPIESVQRELADDLRKKVVDELVIRRAECEWFIEEDFNSYVQRMRDPYVWGGEPELLMACHVLNMPITVHIYDRDSGGLISIAEYGLEYGSENPIRVLYHGFGHYDAVQVPGIGAHSKL